MLNIKVLPANGGDSLLISFGKENDVKNILIDGGIGATYKKTIKKQIEIIKDVGQQIDLLVVTHSHEDHINGIIKFIEDDKNNDCIKKVWFNSGVHFNKEKVKLLKQDDGTTDISLRKIKYLEDKLIEMKFIGQNIWNDELIKQGDTLTLGDSRLTVLSPNNHGIEKLKTLTAEIRDTNITSSKEYDFGTKLSDFDLDNFVEDDSIENATSISFLFEYEGKRILLLADTLPFYVVDGLRLTKVLEKSNRIDYVKLSHHASKGNTSNELLEMIECDNYIVSTSGKNSHKLPNKETFARIVQHHKSINLYFNYKNEKTQAIFENDLLETDSYKINLVYVEDYEYKIEVIK